MKSLFIEKPDLVAYHDPLETFWFMDICPLDEDFIVSFATKGKEPSVDKSDYALLHFVSRHSSLTVRELVLFHYIFKTLLLEYVPSPKARLVNQDIFVNEHPITSYRLEKGFNEYFFHVGCHMGVLNVDYSFLKDQQKLAYIKDFSTKISLDFCQLIGQINTVSAL